MKSFWLTVLLLVPLTVHAQRDCNFNTGHNATVFVDTMAIADIVPAEHLFAFSQAGCVGQTSLMPLAGAGALAMTVWGDDPFTGPIDGLMTGEAIRLARAQRVDVVTLDMGDPYRQVFTYADNALYHPWAVAFDTTTTALLDSLSSELAALYVQLDSLFLADSTIIAALQAQVAAQADTIQTQRNQIQALQIANDNLQAQVNAQQDAIALLQADLASETARADSLQQVIDSFPDLEQRLADANARIAELEAEIIVINGQLAAALDLLRRIAAIANTQGNKYRDICNLLGC